MKDRIIAVIVILALGAGLGFFVVHKKHSSSPSHAKLIEQFIAVLPDSLDNAHILEIRKLFYVLYEREKLGKVKPETSEEITQKMAGFVEKGRITASELNYFMAQVGYNTYKDDSRYNLEDGSVDHPVLNPNSGMMPTPAVTDSLLHDPAFMAGFEQWKKEHPEYADSTLWNPPPIGP